MPHRYPQTGYPDEHRAGEAAARPPASGRPEGRRGWPERSPPNFRLALWQPILADRVAPPDAARCRDRSFPSGMHPGLLANRGFQTQRRRMQCQAPARPPHPQARPVELQFRCDRLAKRDRLFCGGFCGIVSTSRFTLSFLRRLAATARQGLHDPIRHDLRFFRRLFCTIRLAA